MGGVPGSGDDVTLAGTNTYVMNVTGTGNVANSVTVNAANLKIVSLAFASGSVLTVGADFSLLKPGTGNSRITGIGSLQVGGTLTNAGTIISIVAGSMVINAARLISSTGTVQIGATSTLDLQLGAGGGSIGIAAFTSGGVLFDDVGALTITAASVGNLGFANLKIGNSATSALTIAGTVTSGSTITFAGTTNGASLIGSATNSKAFDGVTISGFGGADIIVVNGADTELVSGTSLKVYNGGTAGLLLDTITLTGSPIANGTYSLTSGTITAACYLSGTHLLTDAGEVAVDDLAIGDMLITADAGPQAIRWIGQRAYLAGLINVHHRDALLPIRISAGALSDNVPTRDLMVSPEHMIALDGVLVAAHNLVNGSTITRFDDLEVVKYFHIELDQHAVIFAEGAAAESYLDTGNRNMFTNVLEYAELGIPVGATVPCLPIVSEGAVLAAIRGGIAARAEACGFTTSADAELHLLVDGVSLYPTAINGQSFCFDIAQSARDVRMVSRSAVPAEIDPASADRRRLGVAMAGLTLSGNGLSIDVLAGEKLLSDGFYPADGGHRWTNGAAQVPAALLALMDGAFSVTVQLIGTGMEYPVAREGAVVALASARAPRRAGAQRLVA